MLAWPRDVDQGAGLRTDPRPCVVRPSRSSAKGFRRDRTFSASLDKPSNMTRSGKPTQQGPYLTLTIPEALSLPKPAAPEKQRYEHVVDLLEHRAKHQADKVTVGFSELDDEGGRWRCSTISEP